MIIFHSIIFLFFILFFLIIPSKALFRILRLGSSDDIFIDVGFTFSIGIVFLTLVGFIIRLLGFGFWPVWLIPLVSTIYLFLRNKKIMKEFLQPFHKNYPQSGALIFLVILIGVFAQNIVLFRGGWEIDDGLVFPSIHDNMWNIAIINELFYRFPPQNPAMSGEILKNHHYFYLLFLAIIRYITHIHVFDLYYRWGPLLVSLLYGLSLYAVASILTKNVLGKGLSIVLGYFSGNFAYFLPLFLGINFDWKGSTFFADQPFDQIFNPYSVLGFAFLLFGIYSLYQVTLREKEFHFGWIFITSFFLGALYGFKSFGGIIAILALIFTMVFYYLAESIMVKRIEDTPPLERWRNLVMTALFSLLIFIPVFLLVTKPGVIGMYWFPGWLLTEMMIGQDKLNLPHFAEVESYYKSINNTLGYLKIKLIELLIYTVGNLGIRLLGFFYLFGVLFKSLQSHPPPTFVGVRMTSGSKIVLVFIFFCILVSFFIPLLFNLGRNAYNIVQFTPYALTLSSVFAAIFMGEIFSFFQRKKKSVVGAGVIILLILLAIPVNIKNIIDKLKMPSDLITHKEIEAFSYLRDKTDINDIILIDPRQFGFEPIYVPALSERRVYLASQEYARQTGKSSDERLNNVNKFFDQGRDGGFLKDNKISYIYLLKPNKYKHIKEGTEKGEYKVAYENEKAVILREF